MAAMLALSYGLMLALLGFNFDIVLGFHVGIVVGFNDGLVVGFHSINDGYVKGHFQW